MKKYLIIFLNQLSVKLTYKFNFLTGLFNNFLSIILTLFTWTAIYASDTIGHFNKEQMYFYILATNFSTLLYSTVGVVTLGTHVRTGKLTMYLLRPYSYLNQSFAVFLGDKFIYLLVYLGIFILGLFSSAYSLFYMFALLVFLAVNIVMFFLLLSLISNLGFWLVQMWPLRPIINAIYLFFGGLLFPLDLLPSSLYRLLHLNPFSMVSYQYTLALQNSLSLFELFLSIIISTLWAVIFFLAYQLTFKKGLRAYEGMGA